MDHSAEAGIRRLEALEGMLFPRVLFYGLEIFPEFRHLVGLL
jgi:hypothetical protein